MWVKVKDFPEYELSDLGEVKRVKTGRVLKYSTASKGYYIVALCRPGTIKKVYIHRLVAIHFIDNPINKPFVNHVNGNKKDNSIENLEWSTPKENIQHAYKTGLVPETHKLNGAKLTVPQVHEIRLISGITQKEIAKLYNVSTTTIGSVKLNKTFKNF